MFAAIVQFGWGAVQISHLSMITELVSLFVDLKSTLALLSNENHNFLKRVFLQKMSDITYILQDQDVLWHPMPHQDYNEMKSNLLEML